MKTVGEVLKEKRLTKKTSLLKIEKITKIKKEFVSAIEKGDWNALPEYSTVLGFVKSLAQSLSIDEEKVVALLRRDYSPKRKEDINPKPDISSKFNWSPKLTFWTGFAIVFFVISGYLVFQYNKFVSPPFLQIDTPKENQILKDRNVKVIGRTDGEAVVTVNNQPVLTTSEGDFELDLQIISETREIVVKAVSRSGKETIIRRNIKPEF